jgi:hypothetical protein
MVLQLGQTWLNAGASLDDAAVRSSVLGMGVPLVAGLYMTLSQFLGELISVLADREWSRSWLKFIFSYLRTFIYSDSSKIYHAT